MSDPTPSRRDVAASSVRRRQSPRPTLVVFEIAGKITKPDINAVAYDIGRAFEDYDKIDILLMLREFEGLELGALFDSDALGAQARPIRHARKYGVVGAPAGVRAMIEASDFLSPVDAKTFDLADEAEAWAWIEALPAS